MKLKMNALKKIVTRIFFILDLLYSRLKYGALYGFVDLTDVTLGGSAISERLNAMEAPRTRETGSEIAIETRTFPSAFFTGFGFEIFFTPNRTNRVLSGEVWAHSEGFLHWRPPGWRLMDW
jgi:hypothetical protein